MLEAHSIYVVCYFLLVYVFYNYIGYEKLMVHLEKEFSNENLLFLTIIWQWRDILYTKQLIDTLSVVNKNGIKLPPNVPLSSIVSMQCESAVTNNNVNANPGSTVDACSDDVIVTFETIYLHYIQRDTAPLEMFVNIYTYNYTMSILYLCFLKKCNVQI